MQSASLWINLHWSDVLQLSHVLPSAGGVVSYVAWCTRACAVSLSKQPCSAQSVCKCNACEILFMHWRVLVAMDLSSLNPFQQPHWLIGSHSLTTSSFSGSRVFLAYSVARSVAAGSFSGTFTWLASFNGQCYHHNYASYQLTHLAFNPWPQCPLHYECCILIQNTLHMHNSMESTCRVT